MQRDDTKSLSQSTSATVSLQNCAEARAAQSIEIRIADDGLRSPPPQSPPPSASNRGRAVALVQSAGGRSRLVRRRRWGVYREDTDRESGGDSVPDHPHGSAARDTDSRRLQRRRSG